MNLPYVYTKCSFLTTNPENFSIILAGDRRFGHGLAARGPLEGNNYGEKA
jgi:hypothetical protein